MNPSYGMVGTVSPERRDEAVAMAAKAYRCRPDEILSKSRARQYAHARQYAMWLLRVRRDGQGRSIYSYPAVARAVGLTDHTTAIHAVRAVEDRYRAALQKQGEA